MRSVSSFGSQNEPRVVHFSNVQREETHESDWGIVSHTDSEMEVFGSSSTADFGHGILILDGVDSVSSHNEPSSELSVPKTDSLPSEIGSLSEGHDMFHEEQLAFETRIRQNKRMTFLLAISFFSTLSVEGGFFMYQRNSYLSSVKELQQKIESLEKEKQDIIAANDSATPPWMEEEEGNDSSFLTLLDNCWIKAKMKVKLGDCTRNAGGFRSILMGGVSNVLGRVWNDITPHCSASPNGSMNGEKGRNCRGVNQVMQAVRVLPNVVGDTVASANRAFVSKISAVKHVVDEVQDEFVRASDDFLRASEGFFAEEF